MNTQENSGSKRYCTKCKSRKPVEDFTPEMIAGEDTMTCKVCIRKFYTTFECGKCEKEVVGWNYTNDMLDGKADLECKACIRWRSIEIETPKVKRLCIGPDCNKEFLSKSKFNKLCPDCRNSPEAFLSSWFGT